MVNLAARLVSHARSGEIVISEDIRAGANLLQHTLKSRRLALKGKAEEMDVWVVQR